MFHPRYSLFDDDPDAGGGLALDEAPPAAAAPAKSASEIALEETVARLTKEAADAKADAKYWSDRGRQTPQPAAAAPVIEEEEEVDFVPEKLTPEQIIDGLTEDPIGTMKKLGLVTQAEMRVALKTAREETRALVGDTLSDAQFAMKIDREYPEFSDKKHPLTIRAGEIYREKAEKYPALKGTQELALMAGEQARQELGKDGKGPSNVIDDETTPATPRQKQEARREKIERQVPARATNVLEDDEPELSPAALTMAKALGNDPKDVAKQQRILKNNGR